jgi:hypothetical protein
MARRRYGEVKLKRRGAKIERLYHRHLATKKVQIKVFVSRSSDGMGHAGYQAWA